MYDTHLLLASPFFYVPNLVDVYIPYVAISRSYKKEDFQRGGGFWLFLVSRTLYFHNLLCYFLEKKEKVTCIHIFLAVELLILNALFLLYFSSIVKLILVLFLKYQRSSLLHKQIWIQQ